MFMESGRLKKVGGVKMITCFDRLSCFLENFPLQTFFRSLTEFQSTTREFNVQLILNPLTRQTQLLFVNNYSIYANREGFHQTAFSAMVISRFPGGPGAGFHTKPTSLRFRRNCPCAQ